MKKKYSLFILLIFLLPALPLFSAEEEVKYYEIDFSTGLTFSYNTAKVDLAPDDMEKTLFYPYLALEIDVDVFDYLTIGVVAGYNQNKFTGSIDFNELPLSLRLNEEQRKAMVFGLNLKSEFTSFGYFSLLGKAEFLYFKLFKNEIPIELPVVTGSAAIKNAFHQLTVDLFLQYDGLSRVSLFFGPQLNLLKGKVSVSEVIEDIEAEQAINYRQKKFLGLVTGINIDIGSHIELILRAGLLSKTSFSAGIFYLF
ncbi:MAG: hypothetical protein KAT34_19380 [Candidatus Aminicenantes bacterium]|nr:hypothetical protein [Candidatus Aminicenantes bacterium]